MGRGNSGRDKRTQVVGNGRGGGSLEKLLKNQKKQPTALEAFKENARQLNLAKEAAKKAGAAELEFTDVTGKTFHFYWNGASWGDRPSSMEARYGKRKGTYKAKFKAPAGWG